MNVVILTGRITADPELKYTQSGVAVCTFNLAVDRPTKGDEADFPTIVAWRETAEFVSKYLHKGSKIVARGEVRTRNYEDRDGKKHKVTEIQADRVEFADSKPAGPFA
jgi:single-strand DNA-binding protein